MNDAMHVDVCHQEYLLARRLRREGACNHGDLQRFRAQTTQETNPLFRLQPHDAPLTSDELLQWQARLMEPSVL